MGRAEEQFHITPFIRKGLFFAVLRISAVFFQYTHYFAVGYGGNKDVYKRQDLAGTNLEYRQYGLTNTNPTVNKIMMEMETIPHSRILLFRNIINALIK